MVIRALIQALPGSLVKFFARPYVAGDSLESAVDVARQLYDERGVLTTLDLLQENVEEQAQVEDACQVYRQMVEAAAAFPEGDLRPTLSLKPSSYTTRPLERGEGMDAAGSEDAVRMIVQYAGEKGVPVTCDMEDRHWTEWTLDLVNRLWEEGHRHLGVVLQARLERTEKDLQRIPIGMRVRLVIGIYLEPVSVATQDKTVMKERLLRFAKILLERGNYVEFATHDEAYVRRFLTEVVPATGVSSDRYEVQMLYGVPRDKLVQELRAGKVGDGGPVKVRSYVPFATSWKHAIAYCRRRLMENPSIASAVTRNILRGMIGRS
ncbi:MAG: hypothetical protein CSA62_08055 [Planctomycetota bacterium]|nr:MAG: hypothetical protein CSA62_08055 [Planctomycetota bacterium]